MLQLVVPALFQTDDLLDLLGAPRLPALDRALARGRRETLEFDSLEALICQELGIKRQQDWPIAPIAYAAAGGLAGNAYWLRADPVHVRIERNRLILSEIEHLTPDEATLLCDALAAHFGDSFSPKAVRPDAWYVRATARPDIATTPLAQAAGRDIDTLLPGGSDSLYWRNLLNEVQMLLFNHPVNHARELRGEPVINSVWLWGGGFLPGAGEKKNRPVLCSSADWRALAGYCGAETPKLPGKWGPAIPDDALIILDDPHRHLRHGDFGGWLQAMQDLESNWLQALLACGRPFRLADPLQGLSLSWHRACHWKFWKRKQRPTRQAFEMQAPADPGVDAFGNRYQ
jgi:hypothetical protein